MFLSQSIYRAVLTDMAMSLKGMGFTTVILMGVGKRIVELRARLTVDAINKAMGN